MNFFILALRSLYCQSAVIDWRVIIMTSLKIVFNHEILDIRVTWRSCFMP
jgi:hypothetical protein